jgi:methylglutaconyl-CoA hydratase
MEIVHYVVEGGIAYITMNRPEKKNALSAALIEALTSSFQQAAKDVEVKIIILKAEGDVFCSGADLDHLKQLQHYTFEENQIDSNRLKDLFELIYTLPKVVIAQVQGSALAGGCGLVNVCDFSFAVPSAKLGYTEVRIGFIPAIVMVFLIRKIGDAKARKLVLTAELISANDAKEIGLLTDVVGTEELSKFVSDFANKLIRQNSTQAMGLTKQMLAHVPALSLDQALAYASKMNATARATEDCQKGIAAFLNKQPISWS